ncbi:MAG TPA: PKD domain-containing protein [Thermoanaerobaculia bacterium]|nr:PKD domain-containing protein [Thermoanaerobaculia bacterium]
MQPASLASSHSGEPVGPGRQHRLGLAIGLLLWASSWAGSALAASTPVVPVPSSRWGTLEPRAILMDTSWYHFNFEPGCSTLSGTPHPPYWVQSIALEGNLLVAATGNHVAAWDVSNPDSPVERFIECRPTRVLCCGSDVDWFFNQLAMPAGDPSTVVIAGGTGLGLVVLDTSSPKLPTYQDTGSNVNKVTVLRRSSAPRNVVVSFVGGFSQLALYDLDKAKTAQCHDRTFDADTGDCSPSQSPYIGQASIQSTAHLEAVGRYLVTGYGSDRIDVWDFANVANPTVVGRISPPAFLRALTAWEQGGQLLVAAGTSQEVSVYRFPSGLSCGSPCQPTLLTTLATPGGTLPNNRVTSLEAVRISEDGGRFYLYVGSGSIPGAGPQREWLFDVTNPALADELTPQSTEGYWGWYYHDNDGFDNIDPTDGVVGGSHLFRAAKGLLDVHAILLDAPPTADFTWSPSGTLYVGDTVQLTDLSTRDPTTWDWKAAGSTFSTLQNPSLSLAGFSPGSLQVSLTACNSIGCDTVTKVLELVDPAPTLGSVAVSSTAVRPCETIQFSAVSPGGKPPLTYSWRVLDGTNAVVSQVASGGETLQFTIPGAAPTGTTYRGELTLTNSSGQVTKVSPQAVVEGLESLAISSLSYVQPVVNGVVQFQLAETGATKWEWFWDVTVPSSDSTYPNGPSSTFHLATEGRSPIYTYPASAEDETYRAVARISNCVAPGPVLQEVTVEVPAFLQLAINRFDVFGLLCEPFGGPCQAIPGSEISFIQEVEGAPEFYDYDWNGDGVYEDAGLTSPPFCAHDASKVCHTYPANTSGTFRPNLQIRRGGASETRALGNELQFGTASPPTVSISGPSSLTTGQLGSFSAATSNCSPSPSVWNWTVGSGSISGSSSGSTITVSWNSAGTHSVSATAADGGCAGTSGFKSVSVSAPDAGGGGGGNLVARFTRTPSGQVSTGQSVSFDASTSSGSPATYYWDFGNGKTAGPTTAPTITHSFSSAGTFQVMLEIAKPGDCAFNLCTATTTSSVQVSSGGGGGSGGPSQDSSELAAKFTFGPTSPLEEQAVQFDGSGSTGAPQNWSWDFGDGATANGEKVSHAYQTAGTFTVKLTVGKFAVSGCGADNLCTHTVTKQITVEPLRRDGSCVPGPDTLCLRNRRFEVRIELTGLAETTFANVVTGQTGDSGLFWFFDPTNWEVLVKVLDGCQVTGKFWVFAASTTDQGYILTVTDTSPEHDGQSVQYVNAAGNPAPAITDTDALAVCEAPPP